MIVNEKNEGIEDASIKIMDGMVNNKNEKNNEVNSEITRQKVSVGVQTDMYGFQKELVKIVKARIVAFNKTDDQAINDKLSPMLKRIQKENDELRVKAAALQAKLDALEKSQAKRRKDPRNTGDNQMSKNINRASNQHPLSTPTTSLPIHVHSTAGIASTAMPTTTVVSSNYGTVRRPPIQMVPPVRKVVSQYPPPPRQPHQLNEGFMVIGPNANNLQGVNTQVVATNHGLRMTSLNNPRVEMRSQLQNNQFSLMHQIPGMPSVNNIPWQLQNQRLAQQSMLQQPISQHQIPQHSIPQQPIPRQSILQQPSSQQPIPQQALPQHSVSQQPVRMPLIQQQPAPNNQLPTVGQVHQGNPVNPMSRLPRLKASISASGNGIILTWDYETPDNPEKYQVECYTLFANQAKDGRLKPPEDPNEWKKIGVVNALPLPMACTLTQFASGNIYHFCVVAVDIRGREGERSNECTIRLNLDSR